MGLGQMDTFEGRLAYAGYLAASWDPRRLEEYLGGFDADERARLEEGLGLLRSG